MAPRKSITCLRCKLPSRVSMMSHTGICDPCSRARWPEVTKAMSRVGAAVARGELPRAKTLTCVDCGKPATEYEHRDYTKPLEVVPVCRPCNHKRPSAYDSVYRPEPAEQRMPAPS